MTGNGDDTDVDGGCHDNVTVVDSTLCAVSWRGDEGPRPLADPRSSAGGGPIAHTSTDRQVHCLKKNRTNMT